MKEELIVTHFAKWKSAATGRADELEKFLAWFDSAGSIEQSLKSGWLDFSFHILKPEVLQLLGQPFEKTALEIGYGGGRLLFPACNIFRHCYGVDVHECNGFVGDLLKASGCKNFDLLKTSGTEILLEAGQIDFVYSFIVLQHLPTIGILKDYLKEIYRVMRIGAVGILYFGYLPGKFRKRYTDLDTNNVETVRDVTLRLTIPAAKKMLNDLSLNIIESGRSLKKPWLDKLGGQFYLIFQK